MSAITITSAATRMPRRASPNSAACLMVLEVSFPALATPSTRAPEACAATR